MWHNELKIFELASIIKSKRGEKLYKEVSKQ